MRFALLQYTVGMRCALLHCTLGMRCALLHCNVGVGWTLLYCNAGMKCALLKCGYDMRSTILHCGYEIHSTAMLCGYEMHATASHRGYRMRSMVYILQWSGGFVAACSRVEGGVYGRRLVRISRSIPDWWRESIQARSTALPVAYCPTLLLTSMPMFVYLLY